MPYSSPYGQSSILKCYSTFSSIINFLSHLLTFSWSILWTVLSRLFYPREERPQQKQQEKVFQCLYYLLMLTFMKVKLLIHKQAEISQIVLTVLLQLRAVHQLLEEVTEDKILTIFKKEADRRARQQFQSSHGDHKALRLRSRHFFPQTFWRLP